MGAANDPLEHEADRVADQVMRMPDIAIAGASPQLSRKCAACEEEQALTLHASPAGSAQPAVREAPRIVHEVVRSPGQPLDQATRGFFEPRFGLDLSQVRIHSDSKAAESARAVNARAYTVGADLVFGRNQYAPGTAATRKLLAHELTHFLQQAATPRTLQREDSSDDDEEMTAASQDDAPAMAEASADDAPAITEAREDDTPAMTDDAAATTTASTAAPADAQQADDPCSLRKIWGMWDVFKLLACDEKCTLNPLIWGDEVRKCKDDCNEKYGVWALMKKCMKQHPPPPPPDPWDAAP